MFFGNIKHFKIIFYSLNCEFIRNQLYIKLKIIELLIEISILKYYFINVPAFSFTIISGGM